MAIDIKRSYEITPRHPDQGGGWNLVLLQDGEEAGRGVFPIPQEGPEVGMAWWNAITVQSRAHWLSVAASAVPAAARHAYLLAEAYDAAQDQGETWSS